MEVIKTDKENIDMERHLPVGGGGFGIHKNNIHVSQRCTSFSFFLFSLSLSLVSIIAQNDILGILSDSHSKVLVWISFYE